MAVGRSVAEALLRDRQALQELSWKHGSLFCLAGKQTKAQAFSSSAAYSSFTLLQPLCAGQLYYQKGILCQKDQVYFIFNVSRFPKPSPCWLLAVRRRYRNLSALVQALEQSPAVLCSFQPADWNDAGDCVRRGRRYCLLFFSGTALISQTPSACG